MLLANGYRVFLTMQNNFEMAIMKLVVPTEVVVAVANFNCERMHTVQYTVLVLGLNLYVSMVDGLRLVHIILPAVIWQHTLLQKTNAFPPVLYCCSSQ